MAGIRARDTLPELIVRSGLHRRGFRFRLHVPALPGKPDIVFPSRRAVVFVHGCFWHGHDCRWFRMPTTRRKFWMAKIGANRTRDLRSVTALRKSGWRTMVVWECSFKSVPGVAREGVLNRIAEWVEAGKRSTSIRGPSAR